MPCIFDNYCQRIGEIRFFSQNTQYAISQNLGVICHSCGVTRTDRIWPLSFDPDLVTRCLRGRRLPFVTIVCSPYVSHRLSGCEGEVSSRGRSPIVRRSVPPRPISRPDRESCGPPGSRSGPRPPQPPRRSEVGACSRNLPAPAPPRSALVLCSAALSVKVRRSGRSPHSVLELCRLTAIGSDASNFSTYITHCCIVDVFFCDCCNV